MPCTKCKEGLYKWGETGACEYDTLQECEDANASYEEMKETKIVELVIDPSEEDLAIDCISLVSAPAIEENMVYMSKSKNNLTLAKVDSEKREISGVLTVESWIIEDPKMDKSRLYGFELKRGTWMVKMKIENDDLWSKVKDGSIKGLSIEGYFTSKFQQMQEEEKEPTSEEILKALNEIISKSNK